MTLPTQPTSSRRPYLLRAMHEWIVDNLQTPHLVVDATAPGVVVPAQYVRDGKIILNVSTGAANGLVLGNEAVRFRARFGGASHEITVPMPAVLGIYSRETGQGMIFADNEESTPPAGPDAPGPKPVGPAPASRSAGGEPRKGSHLKIVK